MRVEVWAEGGPVVIVSLDEIKAISGEPSLDSAYLVEKFMISLRKVTVYKHSTDTKPLKSFKNHASPHVHLMQSNNCDSVRLLRSTPY